MSKISASLRRQVEERANHCCEYCLLPNIISFYSHEVDHVIAQKHKGTSSVDNLAYACWRCNRHKGSDLGSFDPETGQFSFLFNPRKQLWSDHFQLQDAHINGITAEGRTTAELFKFNTRERVTERRRLHF